MATIQLEGVDPIRSGYEDVATPVSDISDCNCTKDGPDGHLDLTLKFDTQEIVAALGDVNGVIFPSGITIHKELNRINLYYGAADCTVAVATAVLSDIMDYILSYPEAKE